MKTLPKKGRDSKVFRVLEKLGLSPRESKVYSVLLEGGPMTVVELARAVDIPRGTVYRLCTGLSSRKFVEWIASYPGNLIKAVDPVRLWPVLHDEEKNLLEIEKASEIIKNYCSSPVRKQKKTSVRYYKGAEGMKQLIWNTFQSANEVYGYSVWKRDAATKNQFEIDYTKERVKKNVKENVIVDIETIDVLKRRVKLYGNTQDYLDHKKMIKQEVRVIDDPEFALAGDVYIYNDVYALSFWESGEVFGVEIENEEIAGVQLGIFRNLWKRAVPISRYLR